MACNTRIGDVNIAVLKKPAKQMELEGVIENLESGLVIKDIELQYKKITH